MAPDNTPRTTTDRTPSPEPPHEPTQAQPTATTPRSDTVTSEQSGTPGSYISSVRSYFSYPVGHVVSGLVRRFTDPGQDNIDFDSTSTAADTRHHRSRHARGEDNDRASAGGGSDSGDDAMPLSSKFTSKFSSRSRSGAGTASSSSPSASASASYTPSPRPREASPFHPPPLTALTLSAPGNISPSELILTRAIAEEIRLLVPPRLQLLDTWELAYSVERDGSSLATLFARCRDVAARHPRAGYVLVIKDTSGAGAGGSPGSLFGAYLTDPPRPSPHFYGTGECFLWKATTIPFAGSATASPMLRAAAATPGTAEHSREPSQTRVEALKGANLPPPPSADTTDLTRSTTVLESPSQSGASTPSRLRFKAFPYSGINDYMIFCQSDYLSIGGGDGHYGLWIDDGCEKGISSPSLTFGNEPLSDEGTKFDILGVEMWYIG